ncbi:hypothetical protein [Nocardia sp. CY41]|uniref:hypothetical protein n=1 Tax=Nocardia sp. CY41 TaxID=2608686 RepID=UPI0013586ECA|nr:hypothetical protein [Nocardia sp. CY41]
MKIALPKKKSTELPAVLEKRVQEARTVLAHQHDPALIDALSERELAEDRALAEAVRDHQRKDQQARLDSAAAAAERTRSTVAALADREAEELLLAQRAISEARRATSPQSVLAHLYKRRTLVLRILTVVMIAAMAYSAVTVQHNIAPDGKDNPLFWLSFALEGLISGVLIAIMLSTSDTAQWIRIDEKDVWKTHVTEGVLLVLTVGLNTFPFLHWGDNKGVDVYGVGVHAIAPIMMGVALATHDRVSKRYGQAIAAVAETISETDEIAKRLAELTRMTAEPATAFAPTAPVAHHRAAERVDLSSPALEETAPDVDRALASIARAALDSACDKDLASSARDTNNPSRARDMSSARDDQNLSSARDTEESSSARDEVSIAIDAQSFARDIASDTVETDRARPARDPRATTGKDTAASAVVLAAVESIVDHAGDENAQALVNTDAVVDNEVSRVDHLPSDQGIDAVSIVDREDAVAREEDEENDAADTAAIDRRAMVSLVRPAPAPSAGRTVARGSRAGRAPVARQASVTGALAHAEQAAPQTSRRRVNAKVGPFTRELSRGEAMKLAGAVIERGLSKQPVDVLSRIYEAASQPQTTANSIAVAMGLTHSTVGRAIAAANKVSGPRSL